MTVRSSRVTHGDIVLVKPGSMGDVIHSLPVAHALKQAYPASRITWIVDSRWAPLVRDIPCVDHIMEFPRNRFCGPAGWVRAFGWYASLPSLRPGLVIDLQGLMRSWLMTHLSFGRRRVGLSDGREGSVYLLDAVAQVAGVSHAVDRYLQVLPLCDVEIPAAPSFPLPQGSLPDGAPEQAILLHPFARGDGKSLSPGAISDLCRLLAPSPVVICGMGDCPENLGNHVTDFTNRTSLLDLIGLIRHAAAVISVDSGPMHLAAALGRPLLAIHTWSDPRKVGPYSTNAFLWQGGEIRKQSLLPEAQLNPETPITAKAIDSIAAWAKAIPDAQGKEY